MKERFGRFVRDAVLGAGLVVGSQELDANNVDNVKAQQNFNKAKKTGDPEKIREAQEVLDLALAQTKDEDREFDKKKLENQKIRLSLRDDTFKNVAKAPKNSAEITVTSREVKLFDENGNEIGTATEGSKEWKKLEELRIKANRAIEKERAKATRPVVIDPYYNRSRVYRAGPTYGGSVRAEPRSRRIAQNRRPPNR